MQGLRTYTIATSSPLLLAVSCTLTREKQGLSHQTASEQCCVCHSH